MKLNVITMTGSKSADSVNLDKSVFDIESASNSMLKVAYRRDKALNRENIARTLTRAEVSGGGKKPWKQKGTGRARFGSTRNPIWRKGGIVFGPRGTENYQVGINPNARKLAIRAGLTSKAKASNISVIDELAMTKTSTKTAASLIAKLDLSTKKVLVLINTNNAHLEKSFANVPNVRIANSRHVKFADVLDYDHIVFDKASLESLTSILKVKAAKGGDK